MTYIHLDQAFTPSAQFVEKKTKDENDLETACQEFSGMFFRTCLNSLFKEENEEGSFFGEGHAGQMWKHIFINELATSCKGKTGLEEPLKRALAKHIYPHNQVNNNKTGVNYYENA